MKKLSSPIISFLGAMIVPAAATAASFNCIKASTWVERTVCGNAELSKLDETMAQQYKAKLATATEYEESHAFRVVTRNGQRNWLKFRRNTCQSEQCLIREYKERDGEGIGSYLDNLDNSDLPSKHTFGTFYEEVDIAIYNSNTNTWDEAKPATNSIAIHSIKDKPNMALVEGVLLFTNAHTCHIDSEMANWFQNHWVINAHQGAGAELRVYPVSSRGKTQILLRDVDNRYKQNHCGMRGYFDTKVFESR